jgi:hypothetical protein
MAKQRNVVHIAKHKETGAYIPIIVKKTNKDNEITDYSEHIRNRKGFTLQMLMTRWKKDKDYIINLLHEYQIPAHFNRNDIDFTANKLPIDLAFFFEEYIYGVEKKTEMAHNKLKAKFYDNR